MEKIRFMSRKKLMKIAAEGDKMDFNRQIAEWVPAEVERNSKIGVLPLLIHEHIGGQLVEPHMRTLVGFKLANGIVGSAFVDMKIDTFNKLKPIPKNNASIRLRVVMPSFETTAP
jgi:hypothetical protein